MGLLCTCHPHHSLVSWHYNSTYNTVWAIKTCQFVFELWHSFRNFYSFCASGNRNKYSTVDLLNGLMMSFTASHSTVTRCHCHCDSGMLSAVRVNCGRLLPGVHSTEAVHSFHRKWSNVCPFQFLLETYKSDFWQKTFCIPTEFW